MSATSPPSSSSSRKARSTPRSTAWSSRAGYTPAGRLPTTGARQNGTHSHAPAASSSNPAKKTGRRSSKASKPFCVLHEVNHGTLSKNLVAGKTRAHGAGDRRGAQRAYGHVCRRQHGPRHEQGSGGA